MLNPLVTAEVKKLLPEHKRIDLVMGKDYLNSIDFDSFGRASKRIHHEAKVQRARGPDGDKIDRERVRSRRDREDTKVVNMASATKTRQASGLSPRGSRLYSEGGD